MKNKFIFTLVFGSILLMSTLFATMSKAEAHWRGGCCYRGYSNWVAPALIGGIIGYELSQPRYYTPPPVYYAPPPNVVYVPTPVTPQTTPPGYHWQQVIDPQTGSEKMALMPN
jgi:hypothetical protein